MANTSIFICTGFAYTSTIYAHPRALKHGRGVFNLRPKPGNHNQRHHAADPTRGRNTFMEAA